MADADIYKFMDEGFETNKKILSKKFQEIYYDVKNNLDKTIGVIIDVNSPNIGHALIADEKNPVEILAQNSEDKKDLLVNMKNNNVTINYCYDGKPIDINNPFDPKNAGIWVDIDGLSLSQAMFKKGPKYCFQKADELDKTVQLAINPMSQSLRQAQHNMNNPNIT